MNNGHDRFRRFAEQDRQRLLESIYEVIAQTPYPGLVLFATAMHISSVINPEQALRATLEDVVQRVNTFLVRLNNQGNPQKALLVIDRSQSTESRYRAYISDFRLQGTAHGYIGNIVDIPYFSQSADTRLLQFADFCAYAVFRYYERNDDKFLRRILPKFDRRSPNHLPDGLKHIIRTDQISGYREPRTATLETSSTSHTLASPPTQDCCSLPTFALTLSSDTTNAMMTSF